ncbi:hypothetical protein E3N86_12330 [Cryobacterium sp. Hz7]|uniref:hypothetical protein n=1 Tax=Cryobacterium sp. Hz7 TaxID=1259166 RepID=UPI00106DCD5F|nr:hypothetical protein [Cryobacterium sp. Hz7]TFB59022.1 hypothetical protein E3N86_12330 [Cryobacterium sp. Hz7]
MNISDESNAGAEVDGQGVQCRVLLLVVRVNVPRSTSSIVPVLLLIDATGVLQRVAQRETSGYARLIRSRVIVCAACAVTRRRHVPAQASAARAVLRLG